MMNHDELQKKNMQQIMMNHLVGGLEPRNFMTFHSSWEFHHPTDGYSTPSFFRGVGRKTTNQFC
jgi:hypothetical protein